MVTMLTLVLMEGLVVAVVAIIQPTVRLFPLDKVTVEETLEHPLAAEAVVLVQ
jgi:hypothetical protein